MSRKRASTSPVDTSDGDDDPPAIDRPNFSYEFEEMSESIDKALLTLFSALEEDVWIPWNKSYRRQEAKKVKAVPARNGSELLVTMPASCLLEIASYMESFELLDLLRTCKQLHARKSEFELYRISTVKKLFALLPEQCDEADGRIEGGWPTMMEFLTEVDRKMAVAYGGYAVHSLHRALVGERIWVSLFGQYDSTRCFHTLSYKGNLMDVRDKVKPTFAFCFDPYRFTSPYVLLGDKCVNSDDDDNEDDDKSDPEVQYVGVPFMVAPDHCGGWDFNICIGVPESPQTSRGVDIYDIAESGPWLTKQSPFGKNWPSLIAYFCMATYRNAAYAETRVANWEILSVAWLFERGLSPFDDDNECVTLIPWRELIENYEEDGNFVDEDDIIDQTNEITRASLDFLSSVI